MMEHLSSFVMLDDGRCPDGRDLDLNLYFVLVFSSTPSGRVGGGRRWEELGGGSRR